MSFHEQAIGTGGDRGESERRNEFTGAAARPAHALSRTLHTVGGVEDHGNVAGRAHAAKTAHVDDEITISKEAASLGHGHFVPCRARLIEPGVAAPALHLV